MLASVDTVFSVLDSSFSIGAEIFFRQFIRRSRAVKWMIGADFVINEPSAVHDAFAFTVFPHYTNFASTQDEIDRVFPRDIKRTPTITDDMLDYLRDPKRFHFCFLAQKNRHEGNSLQQARTTIDRAIATIEGLGTGGVPGGEEQRTGYLRTFRKLRQEANANNFNYRLLSDIGILGMLAATVMFWIVRHGNALSFGVFPDRDKMTVGYDSVFNDMAFINFSSLCQQSRISERRDILMPAPALLRGQELFYDPMVRIPDYVAGAISRLDYQARVVTSDHKKHGDLVEKFVSDNPNLAIMQITESIVGMRAANISLRSHSDQQLLFSHMDRDQIVEYLAARSSGFRQGRRRSYRDSLLDNANNMERTVYWLEVLLKGVAAGDPGSVATFGSMQPNGPQACAGGVANAIALVSHD